MDDIYGTMDDTYAISTEDMSRANVTVLVVLLGLCLLAGHLVSLARWFRDRSA